ncbi:hypothetical protein [Pseudomonas sp. Marseille-P9899]|uniref:hypothetical protein n=1 Tax=Pseudomonas sp. Marseille-P9899 TaxID=2730401 RepID=UPI00158DFD60|nr:hypothetical protein [Pseudomonas sp. Marseille-P9899]
MINSPLQYGISISARELAEQTGLAFVPQAVNGVWDVLLANHGNAPFDEVDQRLQRDLDLLDTARLNITRVDRQVDLYRLDLSKYAIAPALTSIESIYREYEGLLEMLARAIREQAAGGLQGAADRVVALGRLGLLGSRVATEVRENLKVVQGLLDNRYGFEFLSPFQEDQGLRDFVSFFYATKYTYARFYLAQVKAALLLHLVDQDPCTPYKLGDELDNLERDLGRQEIEMTHVLPAEVKALVQELVLDTQTLQVSFRSGAGEFGMRFGSDNQVRLCSVIQEWRLEVIESLLFNPFIDHRFRVTHAVSGKVLQFGGKPGAVEGKDRNLAWKISWNRSTKMFNLQYKTRSDDQFNDSRLITRTGKSVTDCRLDGRRAEHPYDNDQQFYIDPYVSAFAERDRLEVDEHLIPGCFLTSDMGAYRLYYRHEGPLELVRTRDQKVVWSAGTERKVHAGRLMLQPDGNFVAYEDKGGPYWATDKYFKDEQAVYKNSVLRVRKDGRVEIRVKSKDIFWITPA